MFCSKCGKQIDDDSNFCPACGAKTQKNEESAKRAADDISGMINRLNDTPDSTEEFDSNDIEKNKAMAVFSYLGLLVLIPIFAAQDSKFAKFHANQGLILFIAEAAFSSIIGFSFKIFLMNLSFFNFFGGLVEIAIGVVFTVFSIIGIVNAVKGKAKELPIIGSIRLIK